MERVGARKLDLLIYGGIAREYFEPATAMEIASKLGTGPIHAFDGQLTSAAVIMTASVLGAPVSTTHVVSSSLMGIGASERPKAVRWAKAQEIVTTWLITIPGAGLVSVMTFLVLDLLVPGLD
mgnify:CR=1 FL=1